MFLGLISESEQALKAPLDGSPTCWGFHAIGLARTSGLHEDNASLRVIPLVYRLAQSAAAPGSAAAERRVGSRRPATSQSLEALAERLRLPAMSSARNGRRCPSAARRVQHRLMSTRARASRAKL